MAVELDLVRLLAPVSPDAPSGVDLRRDQAFDLLQAALEPGYDYPKDEAGREIQVPKARDYPKLRRDALALLGRGRDLRVLVILAEALAVTDGPPGLAVGLTLIRRNLQDHWDTLHPGLDLDETKAGDQAALRLNALKALAALDDMLPELGRSKLLEVPGLGSASLRDWDLATGRSTPFAYETKPELSAVEIVLKAATPEA